MRNVLNKKIGSVNAKSLDNLQNDNIYVENKIINLESIIGIPTRKGLEQGIISNGKLVNVVSIGYGHLPNEVFFKEVESKLNNANVKYTTRSINRDDRSFAVDYILNDDSYIVKVKNSDDAIMPMLRFVNSYDGSNKTCGHFGFFRKVCDNGLHVADTNIGFGVKHRGAIVEIVLPEIGSLVNKFMDNEFYSLSKKFQVMAETNIQNLNEFVKITSEKLKLFKFESSEKNPEPSLNARLILDNIEAEASLLNMQPNLWLGYNAFNELLHDKLKKTFEQQKTIDSNLFETVLSFA